MAHTHQEVAAAFAHGKRVRHGHNMYNTIVDRKLYWPTGGHQLFTVVGEGYSYRAKICQIVVNHHTQKSELWITPAKYSMSTSRHEDMYRHAFIVKYIDNHKVSHEEAAAQVFTTPAVEDGTTRCHPDHALRVLETVHQDMLPKALLPRIRSATRRGVVQGALGRMQRITRRMVADVPVDAPDADTLYECQAMIGFLESTLAIGDIDDMRTAVQAWLTLNDPRHN